MRPLTVWDYIRPWNWGRIGELWTEVQRARSAESAALKECNHLRNVIDRFTSEAGAAMRRGGGK